MSKRRNVIRDNSLLYVGNTKYDNDFQFVFWKIITKSNIHNID